MRKLLSFLLILGMLAMMLPLNSNDASATDVYENMPNVPVANETIELVHPLDIAEASISTQFYVHPTTLGGWTWRDFPERISPTVGNETWTNWKWWIDNWVSSMDPSGLPSLNTTTLTHTELPAVISAGQTVISDRIYFEADQLDLPSFLIYDTGVPTNEELATVFLAVREGYADLITIPNWVKGYAMGDDYVGENLNYYDLDGESVTILSDTDICGYRDTAFRESNAFNFTYYTTQHKYEATRTLSIGTSTYNDVNWFVGFPANRSLDLTSVRVHDLNNGVYLTLGEQYDVSYGGIRMHWDTFSLARTFTITFYALNASASQSNDVPIAFTDNYESTKYNDVGIYHSEASWTNTFGYSYQGQLLISLGFDEAQYIVLSSVIVYDKEAARELLPNEYAVSGATITIASTTAAIGDVTGYDVYFQLDMASSDSWSLFDSAFGSGIPYWFLLLGAVCAFIVLGVVTKNKKTRSLAFGMILITSCMIFILYYAQQANWFG